MIEKAYKQYRDELLRHARKQVDSCTAEDLVQQAFIDLMGCEQVRQVRAFLYRSVTTNIMDLVNLEINHRKANLTIKSVETPPELVSQSETFLIVRQAIAELPPKNRSVVEDVICDGYSYSEAAKRNSTTVAAVSSSVQRARKSLTRSSKLRSSAI